MTRRSPDIVQRVARDLPQARDEGFDRMALAMGSSETPSDVVRLRGGLEGDTFAFRLAGDRFVVKIYVDSGDQASTEFENLRVVSLARVATPEPVLMDGNGDWFQTPSIVMTALPGRPNMHPSDRRVGSTVLQRLWLQSMRSHLLERPMPGCPVGRGGVPRPMAWGTTHGVLTSCSQGFAKRPVAYLSS
jgi:hypothetical protein